MGLSEVIAALGGAAVGGAIAAATAHSLDRRNTHRDRFRREREERGAARLIHAEMDIIEESASAAIRKQEWSHADPLPHGAWDRYAILLAARLPETDYAQLARTFIELRQWEGTVTHRRLSFPAEQGWSLIGRDAELVGSLIAQVWASLSILGRVAYPDARDVERDPDTAPGVLRRLRLRVRFRSRRH